VTERNEQSAVRRLSSAAGGFPRLAHVHRFRWAAEDPFSPHNLYRCRCGEVRPGL
jgi:hypothetical protein